MRVSKRGAVFAAVTLALGMGAAACGDSGDDDNEGGGISIFATEPENPLIPGNTTESEGGKVVDALFTGLVNYDPDNAEPKNAMAESIETTDSKVYTIKIKEGWKFHDGTEVKAKNFVDAWNYTAYTPNAQQGASFFQQIVGYDDVHTDDPDQDGPQQAPTPSTDKMSGLEVVDDHTFKVTLTEPFAVFPVELGYSSFSPLPDSFFADKAAFEAKPIGNGPFKFESRDTKQIKLQRFDDYEGPDKPKVDGVTLRFYTNQLTAYRDVQNNKLDFVDQIPISELESYKDDFDGQYVDQEVAVINLVSFPVYEAKYANPKLRQAVSMAINREEITKEIYLDTKTPAKGYVSPVVEGYNSKACGDLCEFDPDKAKKLFNEAGGFDGTMELWYNTDGGHKDWADAACADIQETLGVQCVAQGTEQFRDLRAKANAREFTQMFRSAWQMDYPSIENFLNPLYRTGASSNDNGYSNPAVDAKLAEADAATDKDEAIKLYQEAEEMILKDMPVIPMWYYKQQSVYSNNVDNVKVNVFADLDLTSVERK